MTRVNSSTLRYQTPHSSIQFIGNPFALFLEATLTLHHCLACVSRMRLYDAPTCQMNNVVMDKVNPSKYCCAFQFHFVFNKSFMINKYICMVSTQQLNVSSVWLRIRLRLPRAIFWRENTTGKKWSTMFSMQRVVW